MFRSLAARLTATYVFAAVVLVGVVVIVVTAFALSMFGISAREESADVATLTPEVVRLAVARTGSLPAAAVSIVRELSRPGLHVAVFSTRGHRRRFLAASATAPDGRTIVTTGPPDPDRPFFGPIVSVPTVAPKKSDASSKSLDLAPGLQGSSGAGAGRPGVLTQPFGGQGPNEGGPPGHPPYFGDPGGAGDSGGTASVRPFGGGAVEDTAGPDTVNRSRPYPLGLNSILHIEPKNVDFPGGRVGILPDPEPLARAIDVFWLAMLPTGLFIVVAAWLLGRYITLQALRPLVETTESLDRFGAGDFTPRPIMTTDRSEIGSLASAYNRAAAQVSRAFDERKAAEDQMRQFIADAGHELRTPLTVIMGFIDVLRRRALADPGTSTKIFDTMLEESRRMKALIDKLIVLARLENQPHRELQTVDLVEVSRSVVESLQSLRPGSIAFSADRFNALVRGNEAELHDAVANLVENAVKYAPESQVDVRVRAEGDDAIVEVVDGGPGIPAAEQAHVFDRFYRGRDREAETEGFGLGLAIAKRAVERAGGAIALWSAPGQGCRFSIKIPTATGSSENAALAS